MNTNYTNLTGKELIVSAIIPWSTYVGVNPWNGYPACTSVVAYVSGLAIAQEYGCGGADATSGVTTFTFPVPAGAVYQITSPIQRSSWMEYY